MNRIPLKELCTLVMGQSPSSDSYNKEKRGLPFYQGNADFGKLHPVTRVWCDEPKKLAYRGNILISVRAPIGAINIAEETCCIGRGLAAIIPKLEKCDLSYLFYVLSASCQYLQNRGTGSTFKAVNKDALENLPVLDYDKKEQHAIGQKFQQIDKLIDNYKRQIDLLEGLVESRFIEMFGEPIANPKKFPVKTIGEITTCILSGQSLSGTAGILQPGQKAVLKVSAVTNGYFKADEYKIINHPEQITKGIYPQAGDLLFSRANTREYVGATALVEKDYPALMLPDKLWKLAFDKEILPLFVKHYLSCQRIRAIMSASSSGTSGSMFNISMDKLREIKIFVPNIDLQKEFQQFTQQVDKSKYRGEKSWHLLYVFYKKAMNMI